MFITPDAQIEVETLRVLLKLRGGAAQVWQAACEHDAPEQVTDATQAPKVVVVVDATVPLFTQHWL